MKQLRTVLLGLAALTLMATAALAGNAGTNLFGVQLTNGMADLYDPTEVASKYISAYDHSEVGIQAQVWRFMTDDYAMNVSVGYGMFSETDKPGNNPDPTDLDFKYTQSSYSVRVGGDRVVNVGERALFYFGPGIEYWSGKSKFDGGTPASTVESENVTRYSLSGRLGGMMKLSKSVSMSCQIGRKLGVASATDNSRKASWWPSSFDAAGGLVFGFGD
jgi:hypothetical protein